MTPILEGKLPTPWWVLLTPIWAILLTIAGVIIVTVITDSRWWQARKRRQRVLKHIGKYTQDEINHIYGKWSIFERFGSRYFYVMSEIATFRGESLFTHGIIVNPMNCRIISFPRSETEERRETLCDYDDCLKMYLRGWLVPFNASQSEEEFLTMLEGMVYLGDVVAGRREPVPVEEPVKKTAPPRTWYDRVK